METYKETQKLKNLSKEEFRVLIGWNCQYCGGKTKKKSNHILYNTPKNEFKGGDLVCKDCDARVSMIFNSIMGKGLVMNTSDQSLRRRVEKYRDMIIEKSVKIKGYTFDNSLKLWKKWISKELNINESFADPYLMSEPQMREVILISNKYR